MFKSIFAKQFTAFIATMLVFLIVLGSGLAGMFRSYFVDQKEDILRKQGRKIAGLIRVYGDEFDRYVFNPFVKNEIVNELQTIHEYLEVSLIAVDSDFHVVAFGGSMKDVPEDIDIPELYSVMDAETPSYQGRIKDISDDEILVVASPIESGGDVKGAVLLFSTMADMQQNIEGVAKITLICISIAGIISFIFIYIVSKTISKPIHEINDAAKVIANGNFEKRLDVKSKDETGQLAESFNHMAESLENQEKTRHEFISNISHDLRSPLTSMRGFLQAMIDGTIPEENRERYLDIVLQETDRLSKLANDILDISKIEKFGMGLNKSIFDLNELIRKTVIMFEARVTEQKIIMNVIFAHEKTNIYADYDKIQRIVYNLIDNAVKFTDTGGKIKVETSIKDSRVYVNIKDNGKGIKPEDQKRIFERFYKGDSSRGQDKSGSGLGLSIVKEFIKAHNGEITLISQQNENEGCEFEFWLELAAE